MVKVTLTSVNESNLLGKEIWKISCKNSRNTYEVSNFGNVRKNGNEFECKVISWVKADGCKKEYKYFSSNHYVHREVYILFIGKITEKFVVHHIDWNSLNNHIENLQCMSKSDHIALHSKGRVVSDSTKKKMSEAQTGKQHSESTRKKISETRTGHVCSESTKKKMSESKTGHVVLESTRKKMSEAKSGEKGPGAKLTAKDIIRIRELLSEGKLTQAEIAIIFNVTPATISSIKCGRTWKNS